jgi:hypothetical protein
MSLRMFCSRERGILHGDRAAQKRFYEEYLRVGEEQDKEFLEKHRERLWTVAVIVSSPPSSGRPF